MRNQASLIALMVLIAAGGESAATSCDSATAGTCLSSLISYLQSTIYVKSSKFPSADFMWGARLQTTVTPAIWANLCSQVQTASTCVTTTAGCPDSDNEYIPYDTFTTPFTVIGDSWVLARNVLQYACGPGLSAFLRNLNMYISKIPELSNYDFVASGAGCTAQLFSTCTPAQTYFQCVVAALTGNSGTVSAPANIGTDANAFIVGVLRIYMQNSNFTSIIGAGDNGVNLASCPLSVPSLDVTSNCACGTTGATQGCYDCIASTYPSTVCSYAAVGYNMTVVGGVTTCEACPSNCLTCAVNGPNGCDVCNTGYLLNSTELCNPVCAANCSTCYVSGPGLCDVCDFGFGLGGEYICTECSNATDLCTECQNANYSICTQCEAGYTVFAQTNGDTTCEVVVSTAPPTTPPTTTANTGTGTTPATTTTLATGSTTTTTSKPPPPTTTTPSVLAIVPESAWSPVPTTTPEKALTLPVANIVLHETLSTDQCFTYATCLKLIASLQYAQQQLPGVGDIVYNFVIGGDGHMYAARGWTLQGDHTPGWNTKSIGVAFLGTFGASGELGGVYWTALNRLIKIGQNVTAGKTPYLTTPVRIYPHYDLQCTDCPGKFILKYIQSKITRVDSAASPIYYKPPKSEPCADSQRRWIKPLKKK